MHCKSLQRNVVIYSGCRPGIHFLLKFNVIFYAKIDIHNKILILMVAIPKRSMLKHWNNYYLIIQSVQ